jgi:hypothetical protein
MPIGQPATYPILEDIMLLARSLVLDTMPGATGTQGEGQILTDTAPFTIPMLNSSIRETYRELGNNGVATLIQDNIILAGLTPVNGPLGLAAVDPSVQVSVTYAGYNDGSGSLNTSLKLAANVLSVLRMWERTNGSGNPFVTMMPSQFGLPSRNQTSVLGDWEYRQDGIYMCGATQATDVRYRAVVSLPAQISGTGIDFASLSVPILDCTDAVAYKMAAFFRAARAEGGDLTLASDYRAKAKEQIDAIILRQVRSQQATNYERIPYGEDSSWGGRSPIV